MMRHLKLLVLVAPVLATEDHPLNEDDSIEWSTLAFIAAALVALALILIAVGCICNQKQSNCFSSGGANVAANTVTSNEVTEPKQKTAKDPNMVKVQLELVNKVHAPP